MNTLWNPQSVFSIGSRSLEDEFAAVVFKPLFVVEILRIELRHCLPKARLVVEVLKMGYLVGSDIMGNARGGQQ
jgi:hypothetical protein